MADYLAWIPAGNGKSGTGVRIRSGPDSTLRVARRPWESPIFALVHGIWLRDPAMARKILRGRILTNGPLSGTDWGTLKVAAKRHTQVSEGPLVDAESETSALSWDESPHWPDPAIMNAFGLGEEPIAPPLEPGPSPSEQTDLKRFQRDRDVRARLMLDGRTLAWARNTNASNRVLHAEINLVFGWWRANGGQPFPPGARVEVSLKPCRMCAGTLWDAAHRPGEIEVVYERDDPGPSARLTALDLGSPERRRLLENLGISGS